MTEDIDVVIIWVDGGDKEWIDTKNKYLGQEVASESVDGSASRYRDWDNLQYVFRGIEKYMPWVRKIHFVTNGQKPTWLDVDNERLHWVKHEDYIPREYLPTFSANPIELNLHRIKGLSERFIFFNDDMFAVSPIKQEDFFKGGLPCDQAALWRITSTDYHEPFWHILLNDIGVINLHFKKWPTISRNWKKFFSIRNGFVPSILSMSLMPFNHFPGFLINHIPQAYLKSSFEEVWRRNPEILHEVSQNRFRNVMDVNQYLIRWWQLCSGRFSPKNTLSISRNFSVFPKQLPELEAALSKHKYKLICINDAVVENFDDTRTQVNRYLYELFPEKSEFEK